ncbi:Histidine kinase [anaerobic digester metagenome]
MPERLTFDSTPPPVFLYLFETSSSDLHFDTAAVFPEHANTVYEFRYNQNNVRIGFHALAYSCPERVTYKYRLIGSSEIWNMTSETTITYTNLGPGDYKFEVIAANENGIWSKEPVVLSFRIVPAFWQTLWFKASMIVLITALITFVIYQILRRKRVREQKERDAERRLINLQMSTINAQLDPHFIFNTITAIGSSVQDRMTDEAYSYFVKMSQLLRTSLKESHSVTRTLDEEIQFVGNYLSLQKYRFADRVSYTIQVDDSVNRKTVVPKMCIQIFAENAVKHGLENKPEGGSVDITINQNEKGLSIIIKDDGVGRTAAAKYSVRSTGVGLRAFREFFSIMNRYNTESAWYRITDLHDGSGIASGTLVEVFIPIGYHYLNN